MKAQLPWGHTRDEPDGAGNELDNVGNELDNVGNESDCAGNEPDCAGNEPDYFDAGLLARSFIYL